MTAIRAGELEAMGFEEPEPGLLEDTPENRKRVYRLEGGWQYERVLDENAQPTGFIRPLSPETLTERRTANHKFYRDLLTEPDNPWSDYVGPDDFDIDAVAPHWVMRRLREWRDFEAGRVPPPEMPFPTRCAAIRHDGTRCWSWVRDPRETTHCRAHLKHALKDATTQARYAQLRLLEMTPGAVDQLEFLAFNAESEPVKLKASTEILDRAGVRAGVDLNINAEVTHTNAAAEEIQQRILTLAERLTPKELTEQSETIQAEVIEEQHDA